MSQDFGVININSSLAASINTINFNDDALLTDFSGESEPSTMVVGQRFSCVNTITSDDLSEPSAGVAQAVTLATVPTGCVCVGVWLKTGVVFSGGGISTLTLQIGISGNADAFAAPYNLLTAVSATNFSATDQFHAETSAAQQILATFTPDGGAALLDLTAGSVYVFAQFLKVQ